ncbi:DMT family transporter [Methylobrevis pamukkalensis]|uniref:Putative DMT superfamily transporter inner membrane protein n=1 Tax=Methylobrevis pamukkalensis TaxID=1439726 RepID=A0A1E3H8A4_9HYPH|nr:DMT family transporter [Methylobrevis pamukkalensis]ODN72562.1 putative DMT superfamily transporter inner membrane protein [Methylobrevis pamukkalensis]
MVMGQAVETGGRAGQPVNPLLLRVAPFAFVFLWSTGFLAAKYAAPVAGPFSLLAVRMIFVVPLLAGIALLLRRPWPSRQLALHAMVAGILIHAVYLGGIFFAVSRGLPSGFAGLIVGLQPMLTAIFARGLLGERLTRAHLAGLGLGLVGVAMVLAPKLDPTVVGALDLWLVPLAVGAVAAISVGTVYQKRFASGGDLLTSTVLQYVGAALLLTPLAALEGFRLVPGVQLAIALGWLVVVLSIVTVLLLLLMIREGAVSKVAALFYLVPPVTAALAFVVFGETLSLIQIAGTVVVAVAVALATRRR